MQVLDAGDEDGDEEEEESEEEDAAPPPPQAHVLFRERESETLHPTNA